MVVIDRKPVSADMRDDRAWSANYITALIGRQFFRSSSAIIVPTCNFTGYECDVLVVDKSLRIVDVEIKISRADFRADAKKEKWWHRMASHYCPETKRMIPQPSAPRQWPPGVWKHYFVMPASIWTDDLVNDLPSPNCGVVLVGENARGVPMAHCVRRARPDRTAKKIEVAAAVKLARLASLRMLDAFQQVEMYRANAGGEG
jgi:hypothetical protein